MEEKVRVKRPHRLNMEDRKRIDFTGITDYRYFELKIFKHFLCFFDD